MVVQQVLKSNNESKKMNNLVRQYDALVNDIPPLIREKYDENYVPHVNVIYRDCKKLANNIESLVREKKIKVEDLEAIKLKNGKRIAIMSNSRKVKRKRKTPTKGKTGV